MELKEIFEWFLLRASFAALLALTVGFVLYKLSNVVGKINVAAKRYGWSFVIIFAICSAWATYLAFPSSDEKDASSSRSIESSVQYSALRSQILLTPEDFVRGYVLVCAVSNEVYDFTAPASANICEKWRLRGANRDRYCIRSTQDEPWCFPFAASSFDKLIVHTSGIVDLGDALARLEPYNGNLGIVPEANWGRGIFNA